MQSKAFAPFFVSQPIINSNFHPNALATQALVWAAQHALGNSVLGKIKGIFVVNCVVGHIASLLEKLKKGGAVGSNAIGPAAA